MAEFSNPNLQTPNSGGGSGSGGDMRSMMVFLLVMLVVLVGFQLYKSKQPPIPPPAAQSQSRNQSQPKPLSPAPLAGTQAASQNEPQPGSSVASSALSIVAPSTTETTIENGNLTIVLTNRGAQAKSWILNQKQYKDHPDPGGHQLDLVNPKTAAFGLPLSLFTYEPALTEQLNEALYQVSVTGGDSSTGVCKAPCSVTFHYAADGIDAVKTFSLDSSYVVTAAVEVRRNGVPVRALLAWPAGLGDQQEALQFASGKFIWSLGGKDDSTDAKKVSNAATFEQPYEFAGIIDLYFAATFLPDAPERATLVTLHNTIQLPSDPTDPNSEKKAAQVIGLAVGDISGTTRLRLYAGPKATNVLASIHATGADGKADGQSLAPLIQFGWLTVIAKPLYLALRGLRKLMGDGLYTWGWAIIIVTVIFNLLMLPTRFMMMKSSLKMMRIQPKVDAIKKRYANLKVNDPKRTEMNAEMMELYKTENVNMYGSCLPMLIQMPLFFAYYRVLLNAVELRQAHWFWLTDLSAPDPIHLLPILIIVTMLITQLITPSPGMDPAQRRMMAFMMPVMFGFMLWHFASGLALYWGTGNVINLAIQFGINQSHIGKEMHEIAARRAAKKAGGNAKTIQGKR